MIKYAGMSLKNKESGLKGGNLINCLLKFMIRYDISVNCNWVAKRWQLFSTHIHTNNTGNVTKQTIYRTTQKYIEQNKKYIEQHKN
jgi:hypothetical protein